MLAVAIYTSKIQQQMSYKIEQIHEIVDTQIDSRFFCKEIDSSYLLTVAGKKYLINYEFDVREDIPDEVICINNWTYIALISVTTGEIVYLSGLRTSFVGITALQRDIIIICDTELFLVNRKNYFPWLFKFFTDDIIDYEVIDEKNILIVTATEGEKTINVYKD